MTHALFNNTAPNRAPEPLNRYFSWVNVLVALALFAAAMSLIEYGLNYELRNFQQQARAQLGTRVKDIGAQLEQELLASILLTNSLEAYIQAKQGQLNPAELAPWLTNLQERGKHIRNIGLAPGNRITYIYPLQGNEAAIGLYYPDNPQQWPLIAQIIANREAQFTDPITLKQGGMGLIYREPVFLQGTDYWGLISTVINADSLFSLIKRKAEQLDITLSINERQSDRLIWGNPQHQAITHRVQLQMPGKTWDLIGYSAPHQPKLFTTTRLLGWLFALLLTTALVYLHKNQRERQLTLRALDASNKRFLDAFIMSPQALALVDQQGRWEQINHSFIQLFGWEPTQLEALQLSDIFAPEQRATVVKAMADLSQHYAADANNSTQFEARLNHCHGQLLMGIVSLGITAKHKNNYQWVVQIIDITQRAISERQLQEEASYNQAILNHIVDGIIVFDSAGNIKSLNPAICNIFHYRATQLLNSAYMPLFTPEANAAIQQGIAAHNLEHTNQQGIFHQTIIGLQKDGTQFPVEMSITGLQRHNQTVFVGVVRDISERVRLDQLKSEFVSTVSHELRTPLTAIIGSLKLLDSGQLGALEERSRKILQIANQNGEKLARLINDLLDMDKLIAGKMHLDMEPLDIQEEIYAALGANRGLAEQHKISFHFQPTTANRTARADRMRLQQVLTNLLSNAIKFSPPGAQIHVRLVAEDDRLRVDVIDQGEGIAPELQHKLFQKFSQVDSSSTRQKGGTGLGLAISKALIEQMQGTIGVKSQAGAGSCFYITLSQHTDPS